VVRRVTQASVESVESEERREKREIVVSPAL
jgi:hypothetical protein